MELLLAGRLACDGQSREGWVRVRRGLVAEVGFGAPPRVPDELHADGLIAPGLVDLQVNGAAGAQVIGGGAALDSIEAALLAHGVTSYLPTVVTSDPGVAGSAVRELAERVADPGSPAEGVHLEGPFLSPEHAGVHPAELLGTPAGGVPDYYGHPAVRLVTIAPELPGALETIAALRARDVVVALGHSAATGEHVERAVEAGATLVGHVFNAMAAVDHRRPGLAVAALADDRLAPCVIADGAHVHPLVLRLVRAAAADRVLLVSDATPVAAAPGPGPFAMAGRRVRRGDHGAAVDDTGRLGGGAVLLDEALRRWCDLTGASIPEGVAAAAERPGRILRRPSLTPGSRADLLLLDRDARVRRVMRAGRWR